MTDVDWNVNTEECPVCGKRNEYFQFFEYGIGTVEQHYYCDRCTYFVEQGYSSVMEGISTDCPEEYVVKAKELGIGFWKLEEKPNEDV